MTRETKLVRKQLSVMHRFLTSFGTRDAWISETAKSLLRNIPNTSLSPGLSDLNKAQLHTNYRTFVLPKFNDKMCPKPPDFVIEKVKIQKKEKNKSRKDNKKIQDGSVSNKESVLTAAKIM